MTVYAANRNMDAVEDSQVAGVASSLAESMARTRFKMPALREAVDDDGAEDSECIDCDSCSCSGEEECTAALKLISRTCV